MTNALPILANPSRILTQEAYLDKILGGWIGKCVGGALGAHHECIMAWIDLSWDDLIPETIPPNDDLDLQVLWLKVLEEKGLSLTGDDLAAAWLSDCWYAMCEYGNFRRNWRNGLKPPYTGRHDNFLYEHGMGCSIRSEIWGYVFPGMPEMAARYARIDGELDHVENSICAEELFAAMAADAFFETDVRALFDRHRHYLKPGLEVTTLVNAAVRAYEEGLSLKDARKRILLQGGLPEPLDARVNVPFTILALLYGGGDLRETILAAARLGYDTDCSMATAGAFIGQILGAAAIPADIRAVVGDELVMGIEYRRPEMTISALARDTAAVGLCIAQALPSPVQFSGSPLPAFEAAWQRGPRPRLRVDYPGALSAAPGDAVEIQISVEGGAPAGGQVEVTAPAGWTVVPERTPLTIENGQALPVRVTCLADAEAPLWKQGHHFQVKATAEDRVVLQDRFGLPGQMLWRLLDVFYDPFPGQGPQGEITREQLLGGRKSNPWGRFQHIDMNREYLDEGALALQREAGDPSFAALSRVLGRPAILRCSDMFLPIDGLIPLDGSWIGYFDAEIHSEEERVVMIVLAATTNHRLWLNGERVIDGAGTEWWAPWQSSATVTLRPGANRLLLKMARRGGPVRASFAVRVDTPTEEFPGKFDWATDLAWGNPLARKAATT